MVDAIAESPVILPEARLEITRDASPKLQFPISTPVVTIGRAPDNLLRLDDPQVSRYHARLSFESGARYYTITDLGSADRTQVNGVELFPRSPMRLEDGDTIQISNFKVKFCLGGCMQAQVAGGDAPAGATMTVMVRASDLGNLVGVTEQPILHIITPDETRDVTLQKNILTLGRAPDNDIVIETPVVSSHHAQLKRTAGGYEIIDLGSLNGLAISGQLVKQKNLQHGDVIYIGTSVSLSYQTQKPEVEPLKLLNLKGRDRWTIGRDATNDSVIDHPTVSRFHARIERRQGNLVIQDLNSTNGVYVNGQLVNNEQSLKPGDLLNIGPSQFTFNVDETLMHKVDGADLRIDAIHLTKVVGKGITLLKDISLPILPREFVVIAGVSGGGKSTLLDALNGFRPATSGTVLVNGNDLYKNFNCYRTSLGYVPQDDIIHKELTVAEAFDYAAQLRMPPDTTRQERDARINEVLEDLALTRRKDVRVDRLSGGQRKRVSIGVELITKPSLFYLDEATSGLDPATEGEIMRLLRRLADQGRTVLLITHATKNVMLCDKVVFLAFNGRVAYFGPPDEGLKYFNVPEFDQIYEKVENTSTPDEWDAGYRRSPDYRKHILDPQRHLQGQGAGSGGPRQSQPPPKVKQASSWQQFWILTRRNFTILTRDRGGLLLMLAATPLLGCLNFFLTGSSGRNIFDVEKGEAARSIMLLFLTAMTPVIVGSFATMRELVKEAEIYRRERMIGLGLLPYLLSKVTVATVFSLYQAAAFLIVTLLALNIPNATATTYLGLYITLFLAILTSMVMGLLVSGLSPTQNVAPLLTILFLLPQIIFSGGMLPSVSAPVSIIKYPFESMITLVGIGRDIATDKCWKLTPEQREKLTEEEKKRDCKCFGPNIFNTAKAELKAGDKLCRVPGLIQDYDPAVATRPEPPKPEFPSNPTDKAAMDDFKAKNDQYAKDYGKWKEDTSKPQQEAEGTVERLQEDYGSKFNVNLIRHWLTEGGIMLTMFVILIVVQKRKDA
jgi:ABC-type multidrug transport system ATPase subunit/pSer/pThr/pTyr-binding forkhead associated (FHA) protein